MKRDIAARNPLAVAPSLNSMPTAGPALPGGSGVTPVMQLSAPLLPAPVMSIPLPPSHAPSFPLPPANISQFPPPIPISKPLAPPPPQSYFPPSTIVMPEASSSDYHTGYVASLGNDESALKRPRVADQGKNDWFADFRVLFNLNLL